MLSLVLAAVFFVGLHLFVSGTKLRDTLVGAIGEGPYMGLFSLASFGGITWLVMAYSRAESSYLWGWPPELRPLSTALMVIAFLLAVVGITTPSPTGQNESTLENDDAASGILRITRHPFLVGVAVWAATHLAANGDTASLVFFGALLVLTVAGPPSIDRKRARKHGEAWDRFAERTSILPFAAIASGRNELRLGELAWWRLLAAVVAFGVVFQFHASWFGVPPA